MKNALKILMALPLIALLSVNVYAQEDIDVDTVIDVEIDVEVDVDVEDVTMDVVESKREHRSRGRNGGGEVRNLVTAYMLEAGDVTQEELDAFKAEREAVRAELSALREAGDQEALDARLIELREESSTRREALSEYIESHEDLAAVLSEQRDQIQDRRDEQRNEYQERRDEQHDNRSNNRR